MKHPILKWRMTMNWVKDHSLKWLPEYQYLKKPHKYLHCQYSYPYRCGLCQYSYQNSANTAIRTLPMQLSIQMWSLSIQLSELCQYSHQNSANAAIHTDVVSANTAMHTDIRRPKATSPPQELEVGARTKSEYW